MARHILKKWLPSPHDAKKLKWLQSFKHVFERRELWSLTKLSVAKACAIGMFIGILPLMPLQMLISGTLAVFFRANILISVALIWITNPITAPPIYYFCYKIGKFILSLPAVDVGQMWTLSTFFSEIGKIWRPLLLGSFVLAVVCSIVSYYAVFLIWRITVSRRWVHRKKKKQALTRPPD